MTSRAAHALARRPFALVASLLFLFAGCSSGLGRPVRSADAVEGADGVQRVEIGLHSFYFEPNRVVVHAGRPVVIRLHNSSLVVPHNFTIADSSLSVSQGVGRKRTHEVRFTPERPGEYEFFCHVGSHAKKGMTGTLVVVP